MKNIPMNAEMTKAILDGLKTQGRRAIKLPHNNFRFDSFNEYIEAETGDLVAEFYDKTKDEYLSIKPKYQIGEIVWVREPAEFTYYDAEREIIGFRWKADMDNRHIPLPSRFKGKRYIDKVNTVDYLGVPNGCLKEMARIFLKIKNIRVERLQDISDDDCLKEGIDENTERYELMLSQMNMPYPNTMIKGAPWHTVFSELWDRTAPKGYKWEDNPYVFVYDFERV